MSSGGRERRVPGNYGSNGLRSDGTSFNVGNQLGDRPSIRLFGHYNSGAAMAAILSGGAPDEGEDDAARAGSAFPRGVEVDVSDSPPARPATAPRRSSAPPAELGADARRLPEPRRRADAEVPARLTTASRSTRAPAARTPPGASAREGPDIFKRPSTAAATAAPRVGAGTCQASVRGGAPRRGSEPTPSGRTPAPPPAISTPPPSGSPFAPSAILPRSPTAPVEGGGAQQGPEEPPSTPPSGGEQAAPSGGAADEAAAATDRSWYTVRTVEGDAHGAAVSARAAQLALPSLAEQGARAGAPSAPHRPTAARTSAAGAEAGGRTARALDERAQPGAGAQPRGAAGAEARGGAAGPAGAAAVRRGSRSGGGGGGPSFVLLEPRKPPPPSHPAALAAAAAAAGAASAPAAAPEAAADARGEAAGGAGNAGNAGTDVGTVPGVIVMESRHRPPPAELPAQPASPQHTPSAAAEAPPPRPASPAREPPPPPPPPAAAEPPPTPPAKPAARRASVSFAAPPLSDGARLNEQCALVLTRARTQPHSLLPALERRLAAFRGRDWVRDGHTVVRTAEGAVAVREAIATLAVAPALRPVRASEGLRRAARDHASDLGPRGGTEHVGSDGSHPADRIERYGSWQRAHASVLHFGRLRGAAPADAESASEPEVRAALEEAVLTLLIDDGDPARGHRRTLLDADYAHVGAAAAEHTGYGAVLVLELAAEYAEAEPEKNDSNNTRSVANMNDEKSTSLQKSQPQEKQGAAGGMGQGQPARAGEHDRHASAAGAARPTPQQGGGAAEDERGAPARVRAGMGPPRGAGGRERTPPPPAARGGGLCAHCGEPVNGGVRLAAEPAQGQPERVYHSQCFACARCARELGGGTFRLDRGGAAVCHQCFADEVAERCAACGRPVLDTVLTALGRAWHPDCFACGRCGKVLGRGADDETRFLRGRDGETPLCEPCGRAVGV